MLDLGFTQLKNVWELRSTDEIKVLRIFVRMGMIMMEDPVLFSVYPVSGDPRMSVFLLSTEESGVRSPFPTPRPLSYSWISRFTLYPWTTVGRSSDSDSPGPRPAK